MAALLVLSNQPVLLYVLAVVSTLGVVVIIAALNTMLLLLFLRRDGQATNWRGAAFPLLFGLGLALGQIALISILRYQLTGTLTGFPGI